MFIVICLRYDVVVMKNTWPDVDSVLKLLPDYDALLGKVHVDSKFLDAAGIKKNLINSFLH